MPNQQDHSTDRQPPQNGGRSVHTPGTGGAPRRLNSEPAPRAVYHAGTDNAAPPRRAPAGSSEPHGFDLNEPFTELTPPEPPPMAQNARTAARAVRHRRRAQRRLRFVAAAAGILLAAGVFSALFPAKKEPVAVSSGETAAQGMQASAVAPLPYAGEQQEGSAAALDWGQVGPVRQSDSYTLTAAPEKTPQLPKFGKVEKTWLADAAFLGDSLTEGFTEYGIDAGGALICGYVGTSPNQIVNRAVLSHQERGDEIPIDKLTEAQPKKLYILLGTNALVGGTNDEGFLAYYGEMLDQLKAALPNTMIFVQSVLPVRPEALADAPGLSSEHLATINADLLSMCAEKGCYYLDLAEAFTDQDGALSTDFAEQDGIHLLKRGYATWLDYLCTHVPYSKANPYQAGSEYYLTDALLALLNDLP